MFKQLSDLAVKLAFAMLLPTLLFISTADLALFSNIDTLGYGLGLVAARAALWLVGTVVLFWLLFGVRGRLFRPRVARTILFLAMFLLLNNTIFSTSSDNQTSDALALIMDGGTLVAALAVAALVRLPNMVSAAALASLLILATAVGQHALAYLDLDASVVRSIEFPSRSAGQGGIVVPARATSPAAVSGNIYHVVLDGFHGPSLPKLLEIGSLENLDGFRHYAKFSANAVETAVSVPIIMRGRLLKADENPRGFIQSAAKEGFWKDLQDHGYRTTVYAFKNFNYCGSAANLCVMPTEFMEAYLDRATIDLWFIRMLPASLWRLLTQEQFRAAESFGYPFSITSWVLGDGGRRWRLETGAQHEMSLIALDRLLADEPKRADAGEYVYYHALPPHAPYVYDRGCNWIRGVSNSRFRVSYQETAICALRLVDRLAEKLKELGRYDDALIIVQSDHGNPFAVRAFAEGEYWQIRDGSMTDESLGPLYVGHEPGDELPNTTADENRTNMTRNWVSPDVAARASGLLMIKDRRGVTTPMDPNQLAQSLQIRPYILDAAGIEPFPKATEPRPDLDSSGNAVYFMAHNKNGGLSDLSNISLFRFDGRRWHFVHTMEEARRNGLPFAPRGLGRRPVGDRESKDARYVPQEPMRE